MRGISVADNFIQDVQTPEVPVEKQSVKEIVAGMTSIHDLDRFLRRKE